MMAEGIVSTSCEFEVALGGLYLTRHEEGFVDSFQCVTDACVAGPPAWGTPYVSARFRTQSDGCVKSTAAPKDKPCV